MTGVVEKRGKEWGRSSERGAWCYGLREGESREFTLIKKLANGAD